MRKKFITLSNRSFLWALGIFVLSFLIYHYITPEGTITLVSQNQPGKPMVTELFAIWGVMFLFSGVVCRMIANIFYPKNHK